MMKSSRDGKAASTSLEASSAPRRHKAGRVSWWWRTGRSALRNTDLDEVLIWTASVSALCLSLSIGGGLWGTGSLSRDVVVAAYSLAANLCVGILLTHIFGVTSSYAQGGYGVNYEALIILSFLGGRTSYKFCELSVRKVVIFALMTGLVFGPDQFVNFGVPQERGVAVRGVVREWVWTGSVGGGWVREVSGGFEAEWETTGLKFVSDLSEGEVRRVLGRVEGGGGYFLPLKPDVMYKGRGDVEGRGGSEFVSSVTVFDNVGFGMRMSTGGNVCGMRMGEGGGYTRAMSFGASLEMDAWRADEFSVTICARYTRRDGEVLRADFEVTNRTAEVRYVSDGTGNEIRSVRRMGERMVLGSVDGIDGGMHNMTDCFLNMLLFIRKTERVEELLVLGGGTVIRAANATNRYGFHGGRGVRSEAEVSRGVLVYGGTGVVFWGIVVLWGVMACVGGWAMWMRPVMNGEMRQSVAVLGRVGRGMRDGFWRGTEGRERRGSGPRVVIGLERAEDEMSVMIGEERVKCVEGEMGKKRVFLVAGLKEEMVVWEAVRDHVGRRGEEIEVW